MLLPRLVAVFFGQGRGRLEQLPRAGDAPFHFGWGLQLL